MAPQEGFSALNFYREINKWLFLSHLYKTEKKKMNELMQLTNRVGFNFKKFWGIKKDRK